MSGTKTPAHALGRHITKERVHQGLSANRLSELAHVPRSTLLRLEAGEVRRPRPDVLQHIANALDIPVADLFEHISYTAEAALPAYRSYLESRYMKLSPQAIDELEIYFANLAEREGIHYDQPISDPGPAETDD